MRARVKKGKLKKQGPRKGFQLIGSSFHNQNEANVLSSDINHFNQKYLKVLIMGKQSFYAKLQNFKNGFK